MMDFSKRYSKVGKKRQRVAPKRYRNSENSSGLWKVAGFILSLAVVAAIIASFWFGRLIDEALAELAAAGSVKKDLAGIHVVLREERDGLMAEERLEVAAAKLGLQPPEPKQIRRPL